MVADERTVPDEAVTAAYAADLAWLRSPDRERGGSWGSVPEPQLRRLLEAAAPAIRAAERDRLLAAVQEMAVTLRRPGNGQVYEAYRVVLLARLRDLLEDPPAQGGTT